MDRIANLVLDDFARELVDIMCGIPLTLTTAGCYLKQVAMSLKEYVQACRASLADDQNKAPRLANYGRKALSTTWKISWRRVCQLS